jgi:hypothetical protein
MTTDTGKYILFRGRLPDLLRLLYPPIHIDEIASQAGCAAVICQQEQDYASDNERVIAAVNETQADDRQAVDEAPWMQGALAYGDADLEQRRNEILSTYKEATPEAQKALIDELAEIQTRLD